MAGAEGGASQANSEQYRNDSISIGESGGSTSGSTTSIANPDTVWGPQAGYLKNLYGQGESLSNNFGNQEQQANAIYAGAGDAYSRLLNPGVNPQLDAYSGGVQRNLERNLLPSIQSDAVKFGQMGSSRQGVAQGLALSDSNQQITNMASNLYNDDMNRMGQAMQFSPQLANFGMGIPWYALQQQKGILGDPTVLDGGGSSTSTSSGSDFSNSYQRDIGGGGVSDSSSWNAGVSVASSG